jgi:dGTPase
MMDWKKLLSTKRYGQEVDEPVLASRSPFHKDQDRIVFSSAFRRLQDKTQVHSLTENDYVRTRLTHSMEVASVGRSLGANVGQVIIDRHLNNSEYSPADFGHIVSAACLAHDIGNPPFGHFGEDTIRHWFTYGPKSVAIKNRLSPSEFSDYAQFEGNAQGLRILTKLQNWRNSGGLRLTYATLATFTKYPRTSDATALIKHDAAARKFGIFQSETEIFSDIASETGLIQRGDQPYWCRHPLTYLVEAADDICYKVIDIEDGFKLGRISYSETEELLMELLDGAPHRFHELEDESEKISYLRAKSIGKLIGETSDIFADFEDQISQGTFEGDLLSHTVQASTLQNIQSLCEAKIFHHQERLQAELSGAEILTCLLDNFVSAHLQRENNIDDPGRIEPRNRVLLQLFPIARDNASSDYELLLQVTDFIAGMTDSYAVSQFQRLKGLMS